METKTTEAFFAARKVQGNKKEAIRFLKRKGGVVPSKEDEIAAA